MNFRRLLTLTVLCLLVVPLQAQSVRQDLLSRINSLRSGLGLAPYRLNTALSSAANSHANWMVTTSQVSHIQENGSSPQTRANANGYNSQWVSENIYMGGLASVDTAWNFWINSSIHYAGLTSPNYQDIGIGTARGTGGQAYVLVFGVPSGAQAVQGNSASGDGGAAAVAPVAIVGYDDVGNIEYQLQAGDTLGGLLLRFGYTWDDLNTLLDLNEFTEADIRSLGVGEIVLVPPPQGTYTPTPVIEETEAVLEPSAIATSTTDSAPTATTVMSTDSVPTVTRDVSGILPTPGSDDIAVPVTQTQPPEPPVEAIGQPVTFVAITPSATAIPTLQINSPSIASATSQATIIAQAIAPTATLLPETEPAIVAPDTRRSGPPLWLVGAIILQVGILGIAIIVTAKRVLN